MMIIMMRLIRIALLNLTLERVSSTFIPATIARKMKVDCGIMRPNFDQFHYKPNNRKFYMLFSAPSSSHHLNTYQEEEDGHEHEKTNISPFSGVRTVSVENGRINDSESFSTKGTRSMTSLFNADIARIVSRTSSSTTSQEQRAINSHDAAEHAGRMLSQMMNLYESTGGRTARPNRESLRLVLWGYANLGRRRWKSMTPINASSTYSGMKTGNKSGFGGDGLTEICGADRMEEILRIWHDFQQSEALKCKVHTTDSVNDYCDDEMTLNVDLLNLLLKAYARCTQQHVPTASTALKDNKDGSKNLLREEDEDVKIEIYPPWLQLSPDSNSSASSLWTYAERAEQTVKYMIYSHSRRVKMKEQQSANVAIELTIHDTNIINPNTIQPNAVSYAYVIEAWARQQPSATKFQTAISHIGEDRRFQSTDGNDKYVRQACQWIPQLEKVYRLKTNSSAISTTRQHTDSSTTSDTHLSKKRYRYDFETSKQIRRLLLYAHSDILDAWGRCGASDSGWRAEEALQRVEALSLDDQVANANYDEWQRKDAVEEEASGQGIEEECALLFESRLQSRIETLYPSYQSYCSAILAISRCSDNYSEIKTSKSTQPLPHERAHKIFNSMLNMYSSKRNMSNNNPKSRPNPLAFNLLLSLYADTSSATPGAAAIAESILHRMEYLHDDPFHPEYDYLYPSTVSYNTVIKAWIESGEGASLAEAENVMKGMNQRWKEGRCNDVDVRPDAVTYGSLIEGWLKKSELGRVESAQNAERLLRDLVNQFVKEDEYCGDRGSKRKEELIPDPRLFTSVINAWAKCEDDRGKGMKQALSLLQLMEDLYATTARKYGNNDYAEALKPDMVIYSSVIDAIARSRVKNSSDLALQILDKLERAFRNGCNDDDVEENQPNEMLKPSVKTYSCVLLALGNERKVGNDEKAWGLLSRMNQMGVQPNAFTYNYIINCASYYMPQSPGESPVAHQENKMKTFKIALASFQHLRQSAHDKTDSYTYSFFLKACLNLLPPSDKRTSILQQTVGECCSKGLMNDQILTRLVKRLPEMEVRDLLSVGVKQNLRTLGVKNLASEWSKNVGQKR